MPKAMIPEDLLDMLIKVVNYNEAYSLPRCCGAIKAIQDWLVCKEICQMHSGYFIEKKAEKKWHRATRKDIGKQFAWSNDARNPPAQFNPVIAPLQGVGELNGVGTLCYDGHSCAGFAWIYE